MPETKKTPDMIFQLSVNKQGVIRGNYFDQVTQANLAVTGQVDKKNQRVAWSVGSGKGIVVETGLYNLTQDDFDRAGPLRSGQDAAGRVGPHAAAGPTGRRFRRRVTCPRQDHPLLRQAAKPCPEEPYGLMCPRPDPWEPSGQGWQPS